MCEPVTIAVAAAGLAVAGGVTKAVGDKMSADSAANRDRQNAIYAEDAASSALQKGESDAGRIVTRGAALQGTQRALYGASGVDVNSGSAARTQEDTAGLTALDAETARTNAQLQAWGLKTQATQFREKADNEETAGWLGAAGDIIGGVAQGASQFIGGAGKAPGK